MRSRIKYFNIIIIAIILVFSTEINVSAGTPKAIKTEGSVDVNYDGKKDKIAIFNDATDKYEDSFIKYTVFVNEKSAFSYKVPRSSKIYARYVIVNKKREYINIYTKYKKKVTSSILIKYSNKKNSFVKINNFLGKKKAKKCFISKATEKKLTVKTEYLNGKVKRTIYNYKKSKWVKQ